MLSWIDSGNVLTVFVLAAFLAFKTIKMRNFVNIQLSVALDNENRFKKKKANAELIKQ